MRKKNLLLGILLAALMIGCASRTQYEVEIEDRNPDDALSEFICENKPENFYYIGHTTNTDNVTSYCFRGEVLTAESISDFANVVTAASFEGYGKIRVYVMEIDGGADPVLFTISNYSSDFIYSANYENLCVLKLGDDGSALEVIHDPQTYIEVDGIKYLIAKEWFLQNAENAGIDWYEVWPDLEGIDTF